MTGGAHSWHRHGMMVIGNDHLGHGETAKGEEELGYFPKAKGSETVVDDLYKVTKSIRASISENTCISFWGIVWDLLWPEDI